MEQEPLDPKLNRAQFHLGSAGIAVISGTPASSLESPVFSPSVSSKAQQVRLLPDAQSQEPVSSVRSQRNGDDNAGNLIFDPILRLWLDTRSFQYVQMKA